MISNNEGKFHYLLVRNFSTLVAGRTKKKATRTCAITVSIVSRKLGCLLLTSRIVPSTQSRRLSIPHPTIRCKISKIFKAIAKTLPVPFVLYSDFEAFLVPAEENIESDSNTKVR